MIYIETGSENVYFNFALEYYFTVEKFLGDTVFLFWRTTPTLMIGKYQNVLEEINTSYAKAHGIHLVRRMSGGGTIYTDLGGWQFTFIQHKDAKRIEFQDYIVPIIDALRTMGIQADFNGRNDLTISGKKFSGNAQYRLANCIVHHGSLLFDTDIDQMVASTTVDEYKIRSKSIKSVRDRVTNISDHLPVLITPDEFKERMVRSIMDGVGKEYRLTSVDRTRIEAIAAERFEGWQNLYGTDPRFNIERTDRFPGGKMTFRLDVKRGVIQNASVFGDFFATVDGEVLCSALVGCRYEAVALKEALMEHHLDGAVYRITLDEIVQLIVGEK